MQLRNIMCWLCFSYRDNSDRLSVEWNCWDTPPGQQLQNEKRQWQEMEEIWTNTNWSIFRPVYSTCILRGDLSILLALYMYDVWSRNVLKICQPNYWPFLPLYENYIAICTWLRRYDEKGFQWPSFQPKSIHNELCHLDIGFSAEVDWKRAWYPGPNQ